MAHWIADISNDTQEEAGYPETNYTESPVEDTYGVEEFLNSKKGRVARNLEPWNIKKLTKQCKTGIKKRGRNKPGT